MAKKKAKPAAHAGRPPKERDTTTYQGRFAVRLAKLREAAGLTRAEAADAAGMTYNAWSNWEGGRYLPMVQDLRTIAKALGCTLEELLPK